MEIALHVPQKIEKTELRLSISAGDPFPNRQDTQPICQQHLSSGKEILGCPLNTTVLNED
jgi:hypothetical protein